jgi:hypothetical protein
MNDNKNSKQRAVRYMAFTRSRAKNEVLARLMDAGKLVFGRIEDLERIERWLRISIRVYLKDI